MSVLPDPDFLHRLADIADAETLPRYRQPLDIETKERPGWTFDPVTEADRSAEVALRAAISATHPDHAILGEEYGETGSGSCRWVLDPVDGTRPFICGIPVWSTLIGFTVEGRARNGHDEPAHHRRTLLGHTGWCMGRARRKALPSSYPRGQRSFASHSAHDVARARSRIR